MNRSDWIALNRSRRTTVFDADQLISVVRTEAASYSIGAKARNEVIRQATHALAAAPAQEAESIDRWWARFEASLLTRAGRGIGGRIWSAAARTLITSRIVAPSWELLASIPLDPWVSTLPNDDPLRTTADQLRHASARVTWASPKGRKRGVCCGCRILLLHGYDALHRITDGDLQALPLNTAGIDLFDAALCELQILARSAQRGIARRQSSPPHSIAELAEVIPEPFRLVTIAYLQAYQERVSSKYQTIQSKVRSLAHFFDYLTEIHPEVLSTAQVLPRHARGFVDWALPKARTLQRSSARKGEQDRTTSYDWFVDVRAMFADLCHWGSEPGSPLAIYVPPTVPLTRHDLRRGGFAAARARTEARMTATVMDLTREIPNIRAFALRVWNDATTALKESPADRHALAAEREAFWDWAFLELLLTTGLRLEEACQLTTLDVLKRQLPNGQIYYLLHVKPSKSIVPG